MDDSLLLDAPWPSHLDAATVPFRKRTVTILRSMGYFDDWSQFTTLTEAEVWSWWNAGVGTATHIRDTGNAAIVNYHEEAHTRWGRYLDCWERQESSSSRSASRSLIPT